MWWWKLDKWAAWLNLPCCTMMVLVDWIEYNGWVRVGMSGSILYLILILNQNRCRWRMVENLWSRDRRVWPEEPPVSFHLDQRTTILVVSGIGVKKYIFIQSRVYIFGTLPKISDSNPIGSFFFIYLFLNSSNFTCFISFSSGRVSKDYSDSSLSFLYSKNIIFVIVDAKLFYSTYLLILSSLICLMLFACVCSVCGLC